MAPKSLPKTLVAESQEVGLTVETLNTATLEEFKLPTRTINGMRDCWRLLAASNQTHETIGRTIFSLFFEYLPETKPMFKASKSAHAAKFMQALDKMLGLLDAPEELQTFVRSMGFKHLELSLTQNMAANLRVAVSKVLESLLGESLDVEAAEGFALLINYVCGAILYIKTSCGERVRVLKASWTIAQMGSNTGQPKPGQLSSASTAEGSGSGELSGGSPQPSPRRGSGTLGSGEAQSRSRLSRMQRQLTRGRRPAAAPQEHGDGTEVEADKGHDNSQPPVNGSVMPTSFEEMFSINASVMGVRKSSLTWMTEVLEAFDTLVMHSHNWDRFQEECDILTIRISKHPADTVNLKQFRGCLLAALRSLLPKEWSSAHEDAWTWLWDSVAKILNDNAELPAEYEKVYEHALKSMDEVAKYRLRAALYTRFFETCPQGQDYFKQSNTRLHFIAEQVFDMCLEIYQSPKQMVSHISALGLRHVGFGVPTELFDPFVVACIETLEQVADSPEVVASFAWAVRLVAKILVRTILEGSTVVMKAINTNSVALLKKAISTAPRSSRAMSMLDIQVGDQHISPLAWSIESGSLKVTAAILNDLLTIRADRSRYYYGVDELWQRHPDIVKKLQDEAPMLLTTLLEGLIWRSHRTSDGMRRVNYYIKHVLVKADGTFADALECISGTGDPSLVSHPTVALLADCLWSGVVVRQFITSRMWNVFSLFVFIMAQEILPSWNDPKDEVYSWLIFTGRVFNYTVGMGRLAMFHLYRIWVWCRNTMRRIIKEIDTDGNGEIDYEEMVEALQKFKDTVKEEVKKAIKALREDGPSAAEAKKAIANREKNMYTLISFSLLMLLGVMLSQEPMFWCSGAPDWPTEYCESTGEIGNPKPLKYRYSIFAMCAMAVHWLILIDLAVFSTEISAFLLVCGHVLAEVKQFLTALTLLLAFGSTISIWCTNCPTRGGDFHDMPNAMISLFAITVGLYQGDFRDFQENRFLLACVTTFVSISVVLLLNLLVAQLNRSYEYIYTDMLGFARLNRASLLVDAMESCSRARWRRFIQSLRLDKRLEFDEGDLGLSGGIASTEPAGQHIQTREAIRRYGGNIAGEAPWPADALDKAEEEEEVDRLDELEELVNKIARKVNQLALDSSATGSGLGGSSLLKHSTSASGEEEKSGDSG